MGRHWDTLRNAFEDGRLVAITQANLANDHRTGTLRLGSEQLRNFAYHADAGLLKSFDGTVLDSTIAYSAHDKSGMAAFVLSCDNNIFIFNHLNKTDGIAHSSFVGKFAKGAGVILVANNKIQLIHAHSGHFRPNVLNIYHVLNHFLSLGIMDRQANVSFISPPFPSSAKDVPRYTGHIPIKCLLDKKDTQVLSDSQSRLEQCQLELMRLQGYLSHATPDDIERYKEGRIAAIMDRIRMIKEQREDIERERTPMDAQASLMARFNALRGIKTEDPLAEKISFLEKHETALGGEKDKMSTLSPEGFMREISMEIRALRNDMEDLTDVIEGLIEQQNTTLRYVYDYRTFNEYVAGNFEALRAEIKPAFYSM